jgi:hypothetical protein
MTSPVHRAARHCLEDYSSDITIGESDGGGYNRFPMDDVFLKTDSRRSPGSTE